MAAGALFAGALPMVNAQTGATVQSVDRYVRGELRRQRIPGLSIAVVQAGRVLLARGYGFANVEHRVSATDSTVYQSGSLGKMFTAALVLGLADSGRLGLDDPIRRHLPDGPPRWDSITVRQLLTHTSGIPDYTDSAVDLHRDYTESELVRIAAALPALFAPGTHWSYSNTGYVLLGAIIGRAGGRFYGDLLHDRIFAPLGMRTARIISEADIVPNRSDGYRLVGDTLRHQEWVAPSLNTTADGSLYLTVHDLARWVVGLDSHRVLSPRDLELAWTPARLSDGGRYPYGFGWMLGQVRGQARLGHTGSWQGFKTSLERFPAFDLTVIVLANLEQARPDAIALGIAGLLEPALVPPHRLVAPLLGSRPPHPTGALVARFGLEAVTTADSGGSVTATSPVSDALTAGFRGSLLAADRRDWAELASGVPAWSELGCDRLAARPASRYGSTATRACYARGVGAAGPVLVTVLYTDEWRVADADAYRY